MKVLSKGRRHWRELVIISFFCVGISFFDAGYSFSKQRDRVVSGSKVICKKGDIEVIKNLEILLYYDLLKRFEFYNKLEFFFVLIEKKELITLEHKPKKR